MLFILVVVAGVYLGIKFIPPYWTYLSLQDPVKEAAMAAVTGSGEGSAREAIIRRAKELGLTLDDDDIEITREETMLVVRVTWVAHVDLPRYRYDLPFRLEQRVPVR